MVQDFFLFLESSFFVGQTFWSSLSFFVGMLTFGCLTPNEPELIDNFGCNSSHIFDIHSTMPQDIGECKYIIYLVASLFKFYETTFDYLYFDWIESHARAAKMIESSMFSGIVRVDAKATRHSDGLDVWHMEVAGLSDNASNDHIIDDAKMSPYGSIEFNSNIKESP
ncbi:unnamed protein product [Rhizophagus irregularis]|nr:unnamed protein product [Rhizophagus irregularis]